MLTDTDLATAYADKGSIRWKANKITVSEISLQRVRSIIRLGPELLPVGANELQLVFGAGAGLRSVNEDSYLHLMLRRSKTNSDLLIETWDLPFEAAAIWVHEVLVGIVARVQGEDWAACPNCQPDIGTPASCLLCGWLRRVPAHVAGAFRLTEAEDERPTFTRKLWKPKSFATQHIKVNDLLLPGMSDIALRVQREQQK